MQYRLPVFGIRSRLVALFLLIFGATLVAFSALLYQSMMRNHQREFDVALLNHTVDLAYSLDIDLFGEVALRGSMLEKEKVFPFSLGQTVVEVWSITGKPVARSAGLGRGHLPITEEELLELPERKHVFRTLGPTSASRHGLPRRTYRLLTYFIDKPGPFDFALQVAAPLVLLEQEQTALRNFFFSAIPLVLVVAAVGAYVVSKRAMAPVQRMIAKTQAIGASDLSERVPVSGANDEVRRLALTLNDLLSRLERAFKGQEAFLADASHQLKTPLAILRGEIDLMRSQPRSQREVDEFLESSSQEVNYLSRVVDDLLLLARIEAGKEHLRFEKLRLDESILEVCSRLAPVASAKEMRLSVQVADSSGSHEVNGDPDLIRVLIENLLGNALKYSPAGTCVTLQLREAPLQSGESRTLEVAISDQGPGIPEADREKVFERFYRGTRPPTAKKGHGIGLSIAKKIAEVHGGSIRVGDAGGAASTGSVFIIRLPATA